MKTKTMLLMMTFLSVSAFAQDKGGNGGGAEYCPNPKPGQLRIQTYDLYEGRDPVNAKYKREISYYDGRSSKSDYLNAAMIKIGGQEPFLAEAIQNALKLLNEKVKPKGDRVLEKVPDHNALFHGNGCDYLQLVNWIDSKEQMVMHGLDEETILRDEDAYKSMDPLNQAANDLHEAAYKVRRAFGLSDRSGSVWVRRLVAHALGVGVIDPSILPHISRFGRLVRAGEFRHQLVFPQYTYGWFSMYVPRSCAKESASSRSVSLVNQSDQVTLKLEHDDKKVFVEPGQTSTFLPNKDNKVPLMVLKLKGSGGTVKFELRTTACGRTVGGDITGEATAGDYPYLSTWFLVSPI